MQVATENICQLEELAMFTLVVGQRQSRPTRTRHACSRASDTTAIKFGSFVFGKDTRFVRLGTHHRTGRSKLLITCRTIRFRQVVTGLLEVSFAEKLRPRVAHQPQSRRPFRWRRPDDDDACSSDEIPN